jgi:hypothetical protein
LVDLAAHDAKAADERKPVASSSRASSTSTCHGRARLRSPSSWILTHQ